MTESGLDIAVELDDHDETVGTGCVGTPMPGREARVVDAEDRPVPAGESGEFVLRGVGLMDGYFAVVFPGSRASRPPGPEARNGQPAGGPQVFKRAGRPRSRGALSQDELQR